MKVTLNSADIERLDSGSHSAVRNGCSPTTGKEGCPIWSKKIKEKQDDRPVSLVTDDNRRRSTTVNQPSAIIQPQSVPLISLLTSLFGDTPTPADSSLYGSKFEGPIWTDSQTVIPDRRGYSAFLAGIDCLQGRREKGLEGSDAQQRRQSKVQVSPPVTPVTANRRTKNHVIPPTTATTTTTTPCPNAAAVLSLISNFEASCLMTTPSDNNNLSILLPLSTQIFRLLDRLLPFRPRSVLLLLLPFHFTHDLLLSFIAARLPNFSLIDLAEVETEDQSVIYRRHYWLRRVINDKERLYGTRCCLNVGRSGRVVNMVVNSWQGIKGSRESGGLAFRDKQSGSGGVTFKSCWWDEGDDGRSRKKARGISPTIRVKGSPKGKGLLQLSAPRLPRCMQQQQQQFLSNLLQSDSDDALELSLLVDGIYEAIEWLRWLELGNVDVEERQGTAARRKDNKKGNSEAPLELSIANLMVDETAAASQSVGGVNRKRRRSSSASKNQGESAASPAGKRRKSKMAADDVYVVVPTTLNRKKSDIADGGGDIVASPTARKKSGDVCVAASPQPVLTSRRKSSSSNTIAGPSASPNLHSRKKVSDGGSSSVPAMNTPARKQSTIAVGMRKAEGVEMMKESNELLRQLEARCLHVVATCIHELPEGSIDVREE